MHILRHIDREGQVSLPVRGAWIEIPVPATEEGTNRSLPVRGAWIEIVDAGIRLVHAGSLPVRGAWIEIPFLPGLYRPAR